MLLKSDPARRGTGLRAGRALRAGRVLRESSPSPGRAWRGLWPEGIRRRAGRAGARRGRRSPPPPTHVRLCVLRYNVVTYVEYQGRICLALEISQGAFDVDEAQHLVGLDLRVYVRASQIWVKRLSARGVMLYPVDLGIQARHKGEER